MEIERIVAPGGSLLHENPNEYIAAGCDSSWRNAAYRTTSLEVYLRAYRVIHRALGRKVRQCIGRVDAADTRDRPRKYNQ